MIFSLNLSSVPSLSNESLSDTVPTRRQAVIVVDEFRDACVVMISCVGGHWLPCCK